MTHFKLLLAIVGLTFFTLVHASYPEKTVKIIIPFPAGAAADNAMRVVGKSFQTFGVNLL